MSCGMLLKKNKILNMSTYNKKWHYSVSKITLNKKLLFMIL